MFHRTVVFCWLLRRGERWTSQCKRQHRENSLQMKYSTQSEAAQQQQQQLGHVLWETCSSVIIFYYVKFILLHFHPSCWMLMLDKLGFRSLQLHSFISEVEEKVLFIFHRKNRELNIHIFLNISPIDIPSIWAELRIYIFYSVDVC